MARYLSQLLNSSGVVNHSKMPTGSVLQVVSVTNKVQSSTTGDTFTASNLLASITPKSASSKIVIFGHFYGRISAAGVGIAATVYRNSTNLTSGALGTTYAWLNNSGIETALPFSTMDSPATTSSTTYTIYFKRSDSAGTAYFGNGNLDSVITLMEIAG